jgi:hypothetical protein
MKEHNTGMEVDDVADCYDDEQYELSSEVAQIFVDKHLIPQLEEFDFNNPDEDYVPGMATFAMFTTLIMHLVSNGWAVSELQTAVEEASNLAVNDTVH